MFRQGLLAAEGALVVLARHVHRAAPAGPRPVDLPAGGAGLFALVARGALARRSIPVEVVGTDVEIGAVGRGRGRLGGGCGLVFGAPALVRRAVDGLVPGQQRIAFQLALDIGLQLYVGELQQLDGLLQLGRDDQALALPKL